MIILCCFYWCVYIFIYFLASNHLHYIFLWRCLHQKNNTIQNPWICLSPWYSPRYLCFCFLYCLLKVPRQERAYMCSVFSSKQQNKHNLNYSGKKTAVKKASDHRVVKVCKSSTVQHSSSALRRKTALEYFKESIRVISYRVNTSVSISKQLFSVFTFGRASEIHLPVLSLSKRPMVVWRCLQAKYTF